MNLNTVTALHHPTSAAEIPEWRNGLAWLAGGTWLFSEPQPETDTLIDLGHVGWPALEVSPSGLDIGATCRRNGSPLCWFGRAATPSSLRSRFGMRPLSAAISACRFRPER